MTVPAPRIAPVPPGPSLLTSARRLPGGLDWGRGIEWPLRCQPSFAKEFCPASPTLDLPVDQEMAHTVPFIVYTPLVCDVTTVDLSDLPDTARELTEAHTAYHVARALWLGEGQGDDDEVPTLRRSAIALNQGDAVDLDDAVGALLAEYERCTGGEGGAVLHAPSALAPFALGGGTDGARVCWPEGSLYRSALGSTFVLGPGYPNGPSAQGADGFGPLVSSGPDAYEGNAADESWVYVTGPVEYDLGQITVLPETERDRVVNFTNRYELWGMRSAIVRFNPCCVFGALVNNPVPWTEIS